MNTHPNNPWRRFIRSLFRTPTRATITAGAIAFTIYVIIQSDVIGKLTNAFINNVFFPLLTVALMIAIIIGSMRYAIRGKWK